MNDPTEPTPVVSGIGTTSIAKNTIYLLGGRWITTAIRTIYAVVLARMLGPEFYGLFNYGISWYLAFIIFAGLGLAAVLSREVGRDFEGRSTVVGQTLPIRLFTSILIAVVSGGIGYFSEGDPRAKGLLLIFSAALIGRSLATWTKEVFNAYESNRHYLVQQALFRPLEVAAGIIVLAAGGGIIAVAVVHTLSWWFQAAGGLVVISKRIISLKIQWSWHAHKNILSQGFILCLCQFMILWPYFGVMILFRFLGGTDFSLGQLALILQVFWFAFRIPESSSVAALPVLSRSSARGDGKDRLFSETMLRLSLIFGSAVGLLGIGLGPWLVTFIFGPNYELAGRMLGYGLLTLIPYSCGYVLYHVYLSQRHDLPAFWHAATGAVTFTLSMFVFVPRLDVPGALISIAAGLIIWAGSMTFKMARTGHLNVFFSIGKPGIAVLMGLAVFMSLQLFNRWLALFAGLAALFGGAILFGGLSTQEKEVINRVFRKNLS